LILVGAAILERVLEFLGSRFN